MFSLFENFQLCKRIFKAFNELCARQWWDQDKIQQYQLTLLKERLGDAKNKVPLYQQKNLPEPEDIRFLSDWRQLPVLTKQEILSGSSSAYYLNCDYKIEDLIGTKSSGSTGVSLNVYYEQESAFLFFLAMFRIYTMISSYMPWYKHTYIYTSPFSFHSLFGLYEMNFISTLTPIHETLEKLRKRPPDILTCYPSHLRSIVDQMSEEDFKLIRPKLINVNSEMSSALERKYLSEKLNAFVFDDYSSEELVRIASQCREFNYHIFDDINYIEILDDHYNPVPDGVVGNIVGSNLHNRAMPFLRYLQGDRGAIRPNGTCACGRKFRILEKFEGRKNDAFTLPDGQKISSGFLLDLTYEIILRHNKMVAAFCLIQEDLENWTLELVPGKIWNEEVKEKILQDFLHDLKQPRIHVHLKIVDEVSRTASGKLKAIISRLK